MNPAPNTAPNQGANKTLRKRGDGRQALIDAALLEFEESGFDGTNSNAIARRAGYAPQTFYRHFEGKLAIFLAAYHSWADAEARAAAAAGSTKAVADAFIMHHRNHRVFRRSLRALTVSDPRVGAARAAMRRSQLRALADRNPAFGKREAAGQLAILLMIERLCDAIADGEFAACSVSDEDAAAELTKLLGGVV